jgi:hypothetical protein
MKMIRAAALLLACGLSAGAAGAQAPLLDSEFVAVDGTDRYIMFASPQLVARQGERITATWVLVVDPPPANGTETIAATVWIMCAAGTMEGKANVARNSAGVVVSEETLTAPPAVPEAGTVAASFRDWVCEGKLRQSDAARFPTIEAAIAGAKAMLASGRAAAGGGG